MRENDTEDEKERKARVKEIYKKGFLTLKRFTRFKLKTFLTIGYCYQIFCNAFWIKANFGFLINSHMLSDFSP